MIPRIENEEWIQLSIPLERDSDGYPPLDVERLWARRRAEGLFEIDNIPFFATGLSLGDVVKVARIEGVWRCSDVHAYSGNTTLRIIASKLTNNIDALRGQLANFGCSTELSHLPNLIAVDVPVTVKYERIANFLDEGERRGLWEYEEASLHH